MKKRGTIYLWTGDGWGKTTSAIGAAIRAAGHDKKVIIIQFMKGRKEKIGEYKFLSRSKNITIKQFGREGWVYLKHPLNKDKELAQQGFSYAKEAVKQKPFLLILDEINLACAIKLLSTKEVVKWLKTVPESVHICMTGRRAPFRLLWLADYVNIVSCKKGPKKLLGEIGIDL